MKRTKLIWLNRLKNKYFLTGIGFVLLLLFNERNSVFDQLEYSKNLKDLKAKQAYYTAEIAKVKKEKEELFGNSKNLEKFAREKYLMKADDEDVFVMIEEK
jgi:cell division protein FtsB